MQSDTAICHRKSCMCTGFMRTELLEQKNIELLTFFAQMTTNKNKYFHALQLYTKEFYETVIKAKLNPGGVFVTQSGPAGVLSSSQVQT